MKYMLLFAGIAVFSFASAQQTDYSDLLKKYKKPQQNNYPGLLKKYNRPQIAQPGLPKYEIPKIADQLPNAKFLFVLPNGNKVYALPQDNMPCVVPDMSQYNRAIPIQPYRYNGPGAIPNLMAIVPRRDIITNKVLPKE